MTVPVTTIHENGGEWEYREDGSCPEQVVLFSGADKPAKESDREAARHNELSPPSKTASTRRRLSTQEAYSGRNPGGEPCKWSMRVAPDSMCTRRR